MKTLSEMTGAEINFHYSTRCSFAYAGTYGHECGKPATVVGIFEDRSTKSGTFYGRRCDECAKEKGGENSGVKRFVPFCAEIHRNEWN